MKQKRYFLVKQWCPSHGQTSEKPSCWFCGGHIYTELKDIIPYYCYTSQKRAERVAEKYNTLHSRAEVVEVPSELIREEVYA